MNAFFSLIYSFMKHLLNTYYVSDSGLCAGDTKETVSAFAELLVNWRDKYIKS